MCTGICLGDVLIIILKYKQPQVKLKIIINNSAISTSFIHELMKHIIDLLTALAFIHTYEHTHTHKHTHTLTHTHTHTPVSYTHLTLPTRRTV